MVQESHPPLSEKATRYPKMPRPGITKTTTKATAAVAMAAMTAVTTVVNSNDGEEKKTSSRSQR